MTEAIFASPWQPAPEGGWMRRYTDPSGSLVAFEWHRGPVDQLNDLGAWQIRPESFDACSAQIGWEMLGVDDREDASEPV
jgi:hypothetical protein